MTAEQHLLSNTFNVDFEQIFAHWKRVITYCPEKNCADKPVLQILHSKWVTITPTPCATTTNLQEFNLSYTNMLFSFFYVKICTRPFLTYQRLKFSW